MWSCRRPAAAATGRPQLLARVVVPHPAAGCRRQQRRRRAPGSRLAEVVRPRHRRHPPAGPLAVDGDQQQGHVADRGAGLDEALDAATRRSRSRRRCSGVGRCRRPGPWWNRCGAHRDCRPFIRGRAPRRNRSTEAHGAKLCGMGGHEDLRDAPVGLPCGHVGTQSAKMGRVSVRAERRDRGGDFDVVILGAGSGGYACALRERPSSGSASAPGREGRSTSAAPVSTSAASRPRRCCTRPRSRDETRESEQFWRPRHARGHRHQRRPRLQGRRRPARLFKGLGG